MPALLLAELNATHPVESSKGNIATWEKNSSIEVGSNQQGGTRMSRLRQPVHGSRAQGSFASGKRASRFDAVVISPASIAREAKGAAPGHQWFGDLSSLLLLGAARGGNTRRCPLTRTSL